MSKIMLSFLDLCSFCPFLISINVLALLLISSIALSQSTCLSSVKRFDL
jgi:hypothetical protein